MARDILMKKSEKKFSKESWRNLSIDGKILVVF